MAEPADRDVLVELMQEFYAETGTPFDADQTVRAFETILADDRLGRVWILERAGSFAGYAVLTIGFSLEYGGRDAFLDDLFVRAEHRGAGLGRSAMEAIVRECRSRRVRALHLEVARDNVAARELYRRFGFVDHGRQLMTATTHGGREIDMQKGNHREMDGASTGQSAGIAWYRADQWSRLREVAADRSELEPTFEEWRSTAEEGLADLARAGVRACKIDVDVEELITWCRSKGRSIDASARAEFAVRKLRERHDRLTR